MLDGDDDFETASRNKINTELFEIISALLLLLLADFAVFFVVYNLTKWAID